MTYKTIFILATLVGVIAANPMLARVEEEVIALSESCVRQGGLCRRAKDCDPSNYVLTGLRAALCPEQHHLGVVCCYM